jgi:hypothetical protein
MINIIFDKKIKIGKNIFWEFYLWKKLKKYSDFSTIRGLIFEDIPFQYLLNL